MIPSQMTVLSRAISIASKARVQLVADLVAAIHGGLLSMNAWDNLLKLRFTGDPGTATPRERKAASRAQRRLVEWSKAA